MGKDIFPEGCLENCQLFNITCTLSLCQNFITQTISMPPKMILECHFVGIIKAIVTISAAVFAIFGNTLVILVARQTLSENHLHQQLLTLLSAIDLVFAILQVMFITPLFWTCRWIYGLLLCKLLNSAKELGNLISVGIILYYCH